MTNPEDPQNPGGGWAPPPQSGANPPAQGQAGWANAPQPAQQGWGPPPQQAQPPAQQGWGPPPQQAQPPAQQGWGPPPQQGQPQQAQPQQGQGWGPPPQQAQPPAQQGWGPPPQQAQPQQKGQGWANAPHPAQQSGPWNPPAGQANAPAQWAQRSPHQKGAIEFFFKTPKELEGPARTIYLALTIASLPILIPSIVMYAMLKARMRAYGVTVFTAVYSHFIGTAIAYGVFAVIGDAIGVTPHFVAIPLVVLAWVPLGARYVLPKVMGPD